MKRYIIGKQKIYGMAFERRRAVDSLYNLSDELSRHIIKCIAYGNTLNCLSHWIKEICNFLSIANRITIKPNNKKLKESDYLNTLFSSMGTDLADAQIQIESFILFNAHSQEPYPPFELTDEISAQVFNAFNSVKDYMLPILTSSNSLTANDFQQEIKEIVGK